MSPRRRQPDGDVRVVAPAGEIGLENAGELDAALLAAEDDRPRVVHLDLRRVEFMDSTAMAVLIRAHQRARLAGHRLAVTLPAEGPVRQVARLMRLERRLDLTSEGDPLVR